MRDDLYVARLNSNTLLMLWMLDIIEVIDMIEKS